VEIELKD